jgi:type IV pilus assembly protein PilN
MIKINLLAEKKPAKSKAPALKFEGLGGTQNLLLAAILALGFVVAGTWYWVRASEMRTWREKLVQADAELARLQEVRKKADLFKKQKELLERKINLITELKKKQSVPVHILDQISKNLPDFLWLDSMTAVSNQISIAGRATTYNAVSNFYDNLLASGYFTDVVLGKTAEVPEGVSFSLSCKFSTPAPKEQATPAPQGSPGTEG